MAELQVLRRGDRGKGAKGKLWSEDELATFLDIWASEEIRAKLDGTVRNTAVFQAISLKLTDMGYKRTAKEIKNKMKNMKRDYKKASDHNRRSGVARKEILHKDKLDIILGDRPSTEPVQTFQPVDSSDEDDAQEGGATFPGEGEEADQEDVMFTDEDEISLLEESILSSMTSPSNIRNSSRTSTDTSREASPSTVGQTGPSTGTKKRPNEAASENTTTKRPRSTKTTRMRDTVSLVADAFQVHMTRSEHAYREEMRKQQKEQQEWRQEMADETKSFNDTMKSFMTVMTSLVTSQNRSMAMPNHDHGLYNHSSQPAPFQTNHSFGSSRGNVYHTAGSYHVGGPSPVTNPTHGTGPTPMTSHQHATGPSHVGAQSDVRYQPDNVGRIHNSTTHYTSL